MKRPSHELPIMDWPGIEPDRCLTPLALVLNGHAAARKSPRYCTVIVRVIIEGPWLGARSGYEGCGRTRDTTPHADVDKEGWGWDVTSWAAHPRCVGAHSIFRLVQLSATDTALPDARWIWLADVRLFRQMPTRRRPATALLVGVHQRGSRGARLYLNVASVSPCTASIFSAMKPAGDARRVGRWWPGSQEWPISFLQRREDGPHHHVAMAISNSKAVHISAVAVTGSRPSIGRTIMRADSSAISIRAESTRLAVLPSRGHHHRLAAVTNGLTSAVGRRDTRIV